MSNCRTLERMSIMRLYDEGAAGAWGGVDWEKWKKASAILEECRRRSRVWLRR